MAVDINFASILHFLHLTALNHEKLSCIQRNVVCKDCSDYTGLPIYPSVGETTTRFNKSVNVELDLGKVHLLCERLNNSV